VPQEAVVGGEQASEHISIGGQALRLGLSWSGIRHLVLAFLGYDPVLALLGIAGAVRLWRTPAARPLLVFTALARGVLPDQPERSRALPAAGRGAARLAGRRGGGEPRARTGGHARARRAAGGPARAGAAHRTGSCGARTPRAEAEERLAELPAGSVVAIDHYGPAVDLSQRALERLSTLRELRTRERQRLEFLQQGALPPDMLGHRRRLRRGPVRGRSSTGGYGVRPDLRARGATRRSSSRSSGWTHLLLVDPASTASSAPACSRPASAARSSGA
jgi:hypothetical protein